MMCEAACEGHYGKRRSRRSGGATGVTMTVAGQDYTFPMAFRRMWKAAISASPPPPEVGDETVERMARAFSRALNWEGYLETTHIPGVIAAMRAALAILTEPAT